MTEEEKTLLRQYLINEGLRLDTDVQTCCGYYLREKDWGASVRLSVAEIKREQFRKVAHDLCALLKIIP